MADQVDLDLYDVAVVRVVGGRSFVMIITLTGAWS